MEIMLKMKGKICFLTYSILVFILLLGCAEIKKERSREPIGVRLEDKTISLYLSALDIDIENAGQNEKLSELNFTLKISVDDDLCDLVDTEVYYQIQYELNHPDSDFLGKIFTFSVNAGRINRGNTATMTIKRLTSGNIALDSISVSRVIVQDLQRCTLDVFRPS